MKKPVLGHTIAHRKMGIRIGLGIDVGHTVGVADDINRFNYSRYDNFSVVIRKRKSKIRVDTDKDHKDQSQKDPHNPFKNPHDFTPYA
jgi:hypothetical protein